MIKKHVHDHATHQSELPMTRASKKMITAILSAVFAAGIAGGYFVPPAVSNGNGNGTKELRALHVKDIAGLREAIEGLKVSAAKAEAKLDLLVTMVRDHTSRERP